MKLKQLESLLSEGVLPFEEPKVDLEQVPSSPHIASHMVFFAANEFGDIEGKVVGDFGCGPGILSIACCLMGAAHVLAVELDEAALETCWVNMKSMGVGNMDLVHADVAHLALSGRLDTVIMNPPFGTRRAGIDSVFVRRAMEHADVVYSLHKSSTREHFVRLADSCGFDLQVLSELRYDIPRTHAFHKQKTKDIFVDLLRFSKKQA